MPLVAHKRIGFALLHLFRIVSRLFRMFQPVLLFYDLCRVVLFINKMLWCVNFLKQKLYVRFLIKWGRCYYKVGLSFCIINQGKCYYRKGNFYYKDVQHRWFLIFRILPFEPYLDLTLVPSFSNALPHFPLSFILNGKTEHGITLNFV